jgi:hypothetical protein
MLGIVRGVHMTHVFRGAAILGAALLSSCTTEGVGRCGTYETTPGTGHVTAVEAAPAGENSCPNDPVKITFDFTPDDPALTAFAATGRTVTIGDGKNPPSAAVAACGLTVASDHTAVRKDERGGSCPPVIFELTDLGGAECQTALRACF